MPGVSVYSASLVVDGLPLHEYEPPEDDGDDPQLTSTRYVQATENANFSIDLDFSPMTKFPTNNKSVHIYIDGKFLTSFVLEEKHRRGRAWSWALDSAKSLEDGSWFERRFMFKNIVTTDDSTGAKDVQKLAKELGCIKVVLFDVTGAKDAPMLPSKYSDQGPVPEKALKGQPIDMSAGLGTRQHVGPTKSMTCEIWGPPLATFCFKYRSKRALQMLDLIATTPETQSLQERDVKSLGLREARELLAQYRDRETQATIKGESERVKQEEAHNVGIKKRPLILDDDDDDDCQIMEVKKRRPMKKENVEVFDLS